MIRTQVQLPEDQVRRLKAEAARAGVSLSEMIRRCIARMLDGDRADRSVLLGRAAEIVGAFPDPGGAEDLSLDHDRYIDEEAGG